MYLTRRKSEKTTTFRLKIPYAGEKKGIYQAKQLLPGCPKIPPSLQLRSYQKQAANNWFANNGRG